MLGRVIDIQLCINLTFFFTTGYFFNLSLLFGIPYSGPISQCMFAFASFHSFADTIVILYFIKPYRVYCTSLVNKVISCLSSKKLSVTANSNSIKSTNSMPMIIRAQSASLNRVHVQSKRTWSIA